MTVTTNTPSRLDTIWAAMSSADRHVLLGHDRDVLDAADKVRLAKVVAALGRRARQQRSRAVRRA